MMFNADNLWCKACGRYIDALVGFECNNLDNDYICWKKLDETFKIFSSDRVVKINSSRRQGNTFACVMRAILVGESILPVFAHRFNSGSDSYIIGTFAYLSKMLFGEKTIVTIAQNVKQYEIIGNDGTSVLFRARLLKTIDMYQALLGTENKHIIADCISVPNELFNSNHNFYCVTDW